MDNNGNENNFVPIEKPISFWKDGLSIDEYKISILVIALICSLFFTVIMYLKTNEINNNWTMIVTALIYAVAGVNAFNSGFNYLGNMFSSQRSPMMGQTPMMSQGSMMGQNSMMSQGSMINQGSMMNQIPITTQNYSNVVKPPIVNYQNTSNK